MKIIDIVESSSDINPVDAREVLMELFKNILNSIDTAKKIKSNNINIDDRLMYINMIDIEIDFLKSWLHKIIIIFVSGDEPKYPSNLDAKFVVDESDKIIEVIERERKNL